jgi:hypothetical protein
MADALARSGRSPFVFMPLHVGLLLLRAHPAHALKTSGPGHLFPAVRFFRSR